MFTQLYDGLKEYNNLATLTLEENLKILQEQGF